MIKALNHQMLRTSVLRSAPQQGVDRNTNVIYGVRLIEKGPLNDADVRPYEVTDDTLDDVVQLGGRTKQGLKSRFSHPSLSNDGIGSYVGRLRNLRRDENAVYADLHISDTAFDTPRGDLGTYVMDLADDDPESFGMSLATVLEDEMYGEPERDDDGNIKLIPLRFKQVYAGDVVDSPAATRSGMFGAWDIPDERSLPAMAEWVMEHYFKDLTLEQTRERIDAYLRKFYSRKKSNLGGADMPLESTVAVEESPEVQTVESATEEQTEATATATEETATVESEEEATTETEESTQETPAAVNLTAGHRYIELFGQQGAVWFIEGKQLEECFTLHITNLQQRVEQLTADNEALQKRLAAALALAGESEALSAEPDFTEQQRKEAAKAQRLDEAQKKGVSETAAKWAAMYDKK